MYQLREGDTLVREDRGDMKIARIRKVDPRRLELTYQTESGKEHVLETWRSTHARIHARPTGTSSAIS
jgi:hypothetical protein